MGLGFPILLLLVGGVFAYRALRPGQRGASSSSFAIWPDTDISTDSWPADGTGDGSGGADCGNDSGGNDFDSCSSDSGGDSGGSSSD
ncbi:hypothetical protein [Inquilinus limosus]|uniref:Uncharacterized protein n=1 Tax=Inquilinus limosus MP06 TaxID=1398085 RepID=A0A0A0CX93_9PROT|nr:hypothetical protein [Inquilinus limosus]KGM30394.1 hypothetical protein P409_33320 [Inquilinus limosus MP06]